MDLLKKLLFLLVCLAFLSFTYAYPSCTDLGLLGQDNFCFTVNISTSNPSCTTPFSQDFFCFGSVISTSNPSCSTPFSQDFFCFGSVISTSNPSCSTPFSQDFFCFDSNISLSNPSCTTSRSQDFFCFDSNISLSTPSCTKPCVEVGEGCVDSLDCCSNNCLGNKCIPITCPDGVLDKSIGENCDGLNLDGKTCEYFGLGGGMLTCNSACGFDMSWCEKILDEPCRPLGVGCTSDDRCCPIASINNYFYSEQSLPDYIVVLRDKNQVYWRNTFVDANYIEYFNSWMDNNYWSTGKCIKAVDIDANICSPCYDLVSTCTSDSNCCSSKCLANKCVPITCGDKNCDLGETIENCPQDCTIPISEKNSISVLEVTYKNNTLSLNLECVFTTDINISVSDSNKNLIDSRTFVCPNSFGKVDFDLNLIDKQRYLVFSEINQPCQICAREAFVYVYKEQKSFVPDSNIFSLLIVLFLVSFILILKKKK